MKPLELLAPAKNLEYGIAAIDHGADAVYVGAPKFGARAAVGNSIDDIRQLCQYAHQFKAKVYATVNTIVFDDELDDARRLLRQLADAGVDAVLVQDMALLEMRNEELELGNSSFDFHASTQTDNRTPEKVRWLRSLGFSRVVLARELSLQEIAEIHRQVPDVELEAFVHGALCVSFSGLCFASQHCFGRSANRGACAQFCRMKFDLIDADGQVIERQRHLLSLKDMNQSDQLEQLAEAGVTSFKIEGRLKDLAYVKNVTAAYSERLNQMVARHPDLYTRASVGRCRYTFVPELRKTFNRGYTHYFLNGRTPDIASFDTPKAVGEPVGTVKELRGAWLTVAGTASFANGDGLCFLNDQRELEGFRVNRAEGNRLFPLNMPSGLRPGMKLYRNSDQQFDRLLARPSAERKIPVTIAFEATASGFRLSMNDVEVEIVCEHQTARTPQREHIIRELTKLGGTPYECTEVSIADDFNYFIPASRLAQLRRQAVEKSLTPDPSLKERGVYTSSADSADNKTNYSPLLERGAGGEAPERGAGGEAPERGAGGEAFYPYAYLYNIANRSARRFYEQQGLANVGQAYELAAPSGEVPVMQCRHCLRYSLGRCPKHPLPNTQHPTWREPLYLRLGDGRRFRLEFDCQQCQMNVYA